MLDVFRDVQINNGMDATSIFILHIVEEGKQFLPVALSSSHSDLNGMTVSVVINDCSWRGEMCCLCGVALLALDRIQAFVFSEIKERGQW